MKQVLMGAAFVMAILVASNQTASAQQAIKIGYFDLEAMISLMPGAQKIDSILQAFSRDSINAEYQFRVEEFNRNDSTLRADSAKMPAKVYQERKQKLFQEFYLLQNWQEYSQQMYQEKQQQLVAPFAQKAIEAFASCDVALIIGTSAVVEPAASLARLAKQQGASVVEINPTETPLSFVADLSLRMSASEGMAELLG